MPIDSIHVHMNSINFAETEGMYMECTYADTRFTLNLIQYVLQLILIERLVRDSRVKCFMDLICIGIDENHWQLTDIQGLQTAYNFEPGSPAYMNSPVD